VIFSTQIVVKVVEDRVVVSSNGSCRSLALNAFPHHSVVLSALSAFLPTLRPSSFALFAYRIWTFGLKLGRFGLFKNVSGVQVIIV
jgi:hypothetical protein